MFIVIEGLDGAGKSTQVAMIREEFAVRGIETEYIHFPLLRRIGIRRDDSPLSSRRLRRCRDGRSPVGGVALRRRPEMRRPHDKKLAIRGQGG